MRSSFAKLSSIFFTPACPLKATVTSQSPRAPAHVMTMPSPNLAWRTRAPGSNGAGSDLAAEYESASSAVTLTISATGGASDAWRVDIRRVDGANWHASMALYARRTSDGTGSGTVSGGTSYQTITTTDQTFFSGAGDRSDVAIQQKLGGISVGIQPNTYATTVYYTVVDT